MHMYSSDEPVKSASSRGKKEERKKTVRRHDVLSRANFLRTLPRKKKLEIMFSSARKNKINTRRRKHGYHRTGNVVGEANTR